MINHGLECFSQNEQNPPPERIPTMNEVMKAILDRYSCRDFSPAPITDDQIQNLVKAALAAPSAMNLQPWRIIVITDKALLDEFDAHAMEVLKGLNIEAYQRISDRGGKVFYNAPCLVVIAKDTTGEASLDCGIATQNVALAAHSMGLGSVICGLAGIVFTGPRAAEWTKRMQIPEGFGFGMSVCVGTAQSGKEPHELDFDKVTYVK